MHNDSNDSNYGVCNKTRVVASYTTLPSRYDALQTSILSMINQTYKLDAIYLTIPRYAARLNEPYPPIPQELQDLCTVVYIETDYGPITKIYGALISETDPNTVIITCDDDVGFAPNFVEIMMSHHNDYTDSAICGTGALIGRGLLFISIVSTVEPFHEWSGFTGFDVCENGRCVDLIFGVAGVLYTRGMFPNNDNLYDEIFKHSLNDSSIFHNDDVLISGYLDKMGVERRIFCDIPSIIHNDQEDALSADIFKMIGRLNESITKVKELGFFPTMEPVPLDETVFGRVAIGIILLILIIVMSVYFFFFI